MRNKWRKILIKFFPLIFSIQNFIRVIFHSCYYYFKFYFIFPLLSPYSYIKFSLSFYPNFLFVKFYTPSNESVQPSSREKFPLIVDGYRADKSENRTSGIFEISSPSGEMDMVKKYEERYYWNRIRRENVVGVDRRILWLLSRRIESLSRNINYHLINFNYNNTYGCNSKSSIEKLAY